MPLPLANVFFHRHPSPSIYLMPSLLSLPRELRDAIIEQVISSALNPSKAPSDDTIPRQPWPLCPAIKVPSLPPHELYGTYGLLLTNHQLHIETKQCLQRSPVSYFVDVMVVGDELLPTWVYCPIRLASSISRLSVDIRGLDDKRVYLDSLRTRMCATEWNDQSLLANLVLYLTTFLSGNRYSRGEGWRIENLVLNFVASSTSLFKGKRTIHPFTVAQAKSLFGVRADYHQSRYIHVRHVAHEQGMDRDDVGLIMSLLVARYVQRTLKQAKRGMNGFKEATEKVDAVHICVNGAGQPSFPAIGGPMEGL